MLNVCGGEEVDKSRELLCMSKHRPGARTMAGDIVRTIEGALTSPPRSHKVGK